MRLETRVDHPYDLSSQERDAMFALMVRHYDHVVREVFEADLAEKQWVIRLWRPETGALCGFSTQMLLRASVDGRPIRALFSGDTIVDREHWGTSALPIAWGRLALELVDSYPNDEWYWFLICKGFRTYRFLSVFFEEFFPRYDRRMPDRVQQVLDRLARDKFPTAYDRAAGLVRAELTGYCLRGGIGEPFAGRSDPHVDYFLARNPRYDRGDELCCLAPLSRANFSAAARRLMATPAFARQAAG